MSRPHPTKSLHFARSVSVGLSSQLLSLAVNFLVIPVLMRALGTRTYGLYILLHTAVSYAMLATLGVGAAVVRYTAEFKASGDGHALRQTVFYAGLFYIFAACLGGGAAWILAPRVAEGVLRLSGPMGADAVFVLRTAAVAAMAWTFVEMALMLLQGLQLFTWHAALSAAQNAGFLLGAALMVSLGFGVRGLALWHAAWGAALAAFGLGLALFKMGQVAGPGRRELPLKDFIHYGLGGGFGRFAWIVTNQFDKVYVARAASLTDTTLYSVPAGLLQRLNMLRAVVSNVILPMMSELHGPNAATELRRMYLKSVRFMLWVGLPPLVFLFALMPQFLGLWLGGEFASKSIWPARVLVISEVFFFLEGQAHTVIFSRDSPWRVNALIWLQAATCLLSWKLLIGRYGILGVAVGSTLAQGLCMSISLIFAHRRVMRLPWRTFFSDGLYAPCLSALLTLALLFPIRTAVTTWPLMIASIAGVLAVYYSSTYVVMSDEDRALLRGWISSGRLRLGLPRRNA